MAIAVNLPLGYIVLRKQALTVPGGVITAGFMGFLLFLIHPLFWTLLVVFFVSSTFLTRYHDKDPIKSAAMSLAEKGGQRDVLQVVANGGVPTLLALIAFYHQLELPITDLMTWPVLGLVIAFAVVNADTWATELGVTSAKDPYWILNPRKTVPRGSSGGISPKGLFASLLASILIAIVYSLYLIFNSQFYVRAVILVILGGLLGSLIDSILGATIQAQYQCPNCKKITEKQYHNDCNIDTLSYRGLSWFSNDLVNICAAIFSIVLLFPFLG